MNPTTRLRFIERFVELYKHDNGASTGHSVRILQQWWSDSSSDTYVYGSPDGSPGEWRDIPLEAE